MSEYGFQGMPDMNTLKNVCDTLSLVSNSIKSHQKHPKGFETIQTYMERDYKVPSDFQQYNYVSQLLQRDGMKMAIEAHRRAMPYCMGTLYWQLNDCWPVTSWSAIDYNYKPKALHFETKKLYNDIVIYQRSHFWTSGSIAKVNNTRAKICWKICFGLRKS